MADPNWPNKWGVQYYVTSHSVLSGGAGQGWGWRGKGNRCLAVCQACNDKRELLSVFTWFCILFLSVLLLLVFSSFAVLLNGPYPNPRVLSFSSDSPPHPRRRRGNRVTEWAFVASLG